MALQAMARACDYHAPERFPTLDRDLAMGEVVNEVLLA